MNSLKKHTKKKITGLLQSIFFLAGTPGLDLLPGNGTVLVIAPHPDDETLGCGATIARLRANGTHVRIVIVTDGAASTDSAIMPPAKRAATRLREAQDAAQILNVPETDLVFLNYPDEGAENHIEKIENDLSAQIWLCTPSLIFAPHGDDGHTDHRAVASIVRRLQRAGKISCPVLSYPMWFWPSHALARLMHRKGLRGIVKIPTGSFLALKRKAAAAHRSQFENLTGEATWHYLDHFYFEQNMRPYELFFTQDGPVTDSLEVSLTKPV